MESYGKILAVVLAGCAAAIFLRGSDFRPLAALAALLAAALLAGALLEPVLALCRTLAGLTQAGSAVFAPVLKASAIGVLTQLACGYCQDAGEKSLSDALELGGTLAILNVSLPLFSAVLDVLKTLMGA